MMFIFTLVMEANEMEIPTSSYILEAKKKRKDSRKTDDLGEDFISLSVTTRSEQNLGPHPESRLMREEDELGEADDGRYTFIGLNDAKLIPLYVRVCRVH
jgi:Nineteen complex-related protein 2